MPPIRVGLLTTDVARLEPWELRLFEKICSDPRFSLAAVISGGVTDPKAAPGLTDRLFKLDASRAAGIEPFVGTAFPAALTSAEVIYLRASSDSAHALRAAADLACDVWLVLGHDHMARELSRSANFGAWWLDFADRRLATASAYQALASLTCGPLVPVALVATLNGELETREIAAASFNLERTPARTLARTAEKSVALVWRALEALEKDRALPATNAVAAVGNGRSQPSTDVAGALKYGSALSSVAGERVGRKVAELQGRHHMRWSLFFGVGRFDASKLAETFEVRPPKGEFWADPFLFERASETYVFFENYVYATGLGKISVGIYRDGKMQVLGDALDLTYHLSFPLVFEHDGAIYMMPETSAAKRVEVWKCVEFPLRWELFATALEGVSVADPVLFNDAGTWWLFANISTTPFEDHCNELHVFKVDGPGLNRVTAHPLNPVVIGADTARNAGRITRRDGRLVRMSQMNAHGVYGWGLNMMEITELSLTAYRERLIASVAPDFKPGLNGCHHMDESARLFVVDGCRRLD